MKKILMAIVAACFASSPLLAQSSTGGFSLDESTVYYGVRLGANFAGLSSDPDLDLGTRMGMNLGAVVGLRVSETTPIFLESGLYYTQRGGKKNKNVVELNYLEIPVLIKYSVQLTDEVAILPYVGPYFSYGFSGKTKSHDPATGTVEKSSSYSSHNFKHGDMGFKIGCGAEYDHLYLEMGYQFGVANVAKDYGNQDPTVRNHALYVNFGINF